MASEPEYLTGKPAAIKAFLDKFDVKHPSLRFAQKAIWID